MSRKVLNYILLICSFFLVFISLWIFLAMSDTRSRFPESGKDNNNRVLSSSELPLLNWLKTRILNVNISFSKSPTLTIDEKAALIEKGTDNLPARFYYKVFGKMTGKNKSCATFPNIDFINYVEKYWQELDTSDGPYYLYGAYYDNRRLAKGSPAVRIIGQIAKTRIKTSLFCQLWFEEFRQPVLVPVYDQRVIVTPRESVNRDGYLHPYIFSCKVPKKYTYAIPQAVSVVVKACDNAQNMLKVNYLLPPSGKKEEFAVCVKGIVYPFIDYSIRLVEWLELLFILGAHKVFLYDLDMHPNISQIINYYVKQGRIELNKLPLPGRQPNAFGLKGNYLTTYAHYRFSQEVVPINDCFMKNIHRYEYISILDIDEVIVPQSSLSWKTLMNSVIPNVLKNSGILPRTSFRIRHVYFLHRMTPANEIISDVPRYMHMLQHVYRFRDFTPFGHMSEKSFIKTDRVFIVNNHFAEVCFAGPCAPYYVDTKDAYLQHYRKDVSKHLKGLSSNKVVKDTNLLRYKDALISGVTKALSKIGFFDQLLPKQK